MGSALLHRPVKQVVGDAQGWAQRHKATVVWQAISVAVMRFVAQQLLPMTAVVTTSELPSTSDPWGGVASGMQVAAEDRGADVGIREAVATGSESALPMGPGVGRPGTLDERGEAATPAPPVGRAMALLGMPGDGRDGPQGTATQWLDAVGSPLGTVGWEVAEVREEGPAKEETRWMRCGPLRIAPMLVD